MKIKIIADTSIRGVPAFKNQIVEVDETEARILISYRLAERYVEPRQEIDPMLTENKTEEPKPVRRGKR